MYDCVYTMRLFFYYLLNLFESFCDSTNLIFAVDLVRSIMKQLTFKSFYFIPFFLRYLIV